jgi:hypothetical protein
VSWGAEGVFNVKLKITMVMPFLEGESEALVMEELRVKLAFSLCWDENHLEVVGAFGGAGMGDAFGFTV